jgi:hypothetical protein
MLTHVELQTVSSEKPPNFIENVPESSEFPWMKLVYVAREILFSTEFKIGRCLPEDPAVAAAKEPRSSASRWIIVIGSNP